MVVRGKTWRQGHPGQTEKNSNVVKRKRRSTARLGTTMADKRRKGRTKRGGLAARTGRGLVTRRKR